eukprot:scaffold4097_cov166-Amphora_coffeaeformis.AAC.26
MPMLQRTILWALLFAQATAFTVIPVVQITRQNDVAIPTFSSSQRRDLRVLNAGGFEWEDPGETFDQGVDNPFKNPELMQGDEGMKIDPARLLGPRLGGSNLYFVGMMGCGKSAVGDKVARREYIDSAKVATGMTIPEIFKAEGEEGFRNAESGGIVTRMENWSKLQTGIVVWLDCAPETIMKRIEGTDRPLLQTDDPLQKLKDLLEERNDKYSQADVRIEVTEDMDENAVADTVIRTLHDFIDGTFCIFTQSQSNTVSHDLSSRLFHNCCYSNYFMQTHTDNPPAWKLAKAKAQAEGLDWVQ